VILCFSLGYVYAQTSLSFSTIIENGSMVTPSIYVIFKDGSTYYARNGTTGEIEFYGTDGTVLIDSVLGSITGGVITFLPASYIMDITVEKSNLKIEGYGASITGNIILGSVSVRYNFLGIEGLTVYGRTQIKNCDNAFVVNSKCYGYGLLIDGTGGWCSLTSIRNTQISNNTGGGTDFKCRNDAMFLRIEDVYIIGGTGREPFNFDTSFCDSVIYGLTAETAGSEMATAHIKGTRNKIYVQIIGGNLSLYQSWENTFDIMLDSFPTAADGGYLVDGGNVTKALGVYNVIHSTPIYPSYQRLKNYGFVTNVHTNDWIPHGLIAEPDVITISYGTIMVDAQHGAIVVGILQKNATHFQIQAFMWHNDTRNWEGVYAPYYVWIWWEAIINSGEGE
jgi:hypothetical protein